METTIRGACGQDGCLETRYYLESGLWFCRQGHQQEGREVIVDDDDFGTQGRTSRLKTPQSTERVSRTYYGSQAYQLFLEAYQLILWKQCYALIHNKGLPGELEAIVKDLWSLRLRKIYDTRDDIYVSDDTSQVFSSQTEASTAADEEEKRYHRRRLNYSPSLIHTLGLCYLGLLLLRVPVSIGFMLRWALKDEVPFIRAIRFIPQEMKDRLPAAYHRALDTTSVPTGEQLHLAVADLVVLYHKDFGVTFPPINTPPMLYAYIKQLAFPLELFPSVAYLRECTGFTYTYPQTVVGKFRRIYLPEVQLMSLLIVAVKLFYPLDDIARYPSSSREPAAQVMNWDAWIEAQRSFETRAKEAGRIEGGKEIDVREADAFKMTSEQLDEYMDWYEKMWISGKSTNPLADMFTTARMDAGDTAASSNGQVEDEDTAVLNKLQRVLGRLTISKVAPNRETLGLENIPRPGSYYQRYRWEGQMPPKTREFYDVAARLVGVSLRTLVTAVWQTEHKIKLGSNGNGSMGKGKGVERAESSDEDPEDQDEAVVGQGLL